MKIKQLLIVVPLVLGALVGCVDEDPALELVTVGFPPDPTDCSISVAGVSRSGGSLDIAATGLGYVTGLEFVSNVAVREPDVISDVPVTSDGSTVYLKAMTLTYGSEDGETEDLGLEPTDILLSGTLEPGEKGTLVANLLTDEAVDALRAAVGVGGSTLLVVRVKLKGETSSGAKVESNEISYPIEVFNSGVACRAPLTGACDFPGQDGRACTTADGGTGADAGP